MRKASEANWTHVGSSAVRAVRYRAGQAELDVCFEEGRQYRYERVPRSKFRALLTADSIGAFVNREIKPYHPFRELTSYSRPKLPAARGHAAKGD